MVVTIEDLNKGSISADASTPEGRFWACDVDTMTNLYFEICTSAFLDGCINYLNRENISIEDKRSMVFSLFKNSYFSKETLAEFLSNKILDKLI